MNSPRQRRKSPSVSNRSKIEKPVGLLTQLDENPPEPTNTITLEQISLPHSQPRRYFDPEKQQQLVESVKRDGILQPLLVRPLENKRYELVAGERRLRAAQVAGLAEVPVMIREMTDAEATLYALTENLQREDLNPVEETEGILQMLALQLARTAEEVKALLYRMQKESQGKRTADNVIGQADGETVRAVFEALGRMSWDSFVANRLPLLNLPKEVLEALRQGRIEYTKAREIAKLKESSARQQLLEDAIAQELSLSQIREQVKALKPKPAPEPLPTPTQQEIKHTKTRLKKLYDLTREANLENPAIHQKAQELISQLEALLVTKSTKVPDNGVDD
ncbi:MAG: ParB/RepB/Spo0J family partition protein [Nostoc sp. DedQUE01]